MRQANIAGLLLAADAFFSGQRALVVELARHPWPVIYGWRGFAEAGGLARFGFNVLASYRQVALIAARILNGEKPADLPLKQPTI